jgi:hypothetical protein
VLLRAGDIVEVKSKEEILATLDESGRLDHMPFMPEMLAYCGQRFEVAAIAHKTCDTINASGGRRLPRTVHLKGLRCDGSAHDGCQAACNLFWKTAWLRKPGAAGSPLAGPSATVARCDEEALRRAAYRDEDGVRRYSCQATELLRSTKALPWWDPAQYARDVISGNYSLGHALRTLVLAGLRMVIRTGHAFRAMLALHDKLAAITGGRRFVDPVGPIPRGAPTPSSPLALREGDWVAVRPYQEILSTLNTAGLNRGLTFDPEMVPYCGGKYRVRAVVEKIIEEKTGHMLRMRAPCIMLEGVVCKSEYIRKRLMCPRAVFPYWRPLWLERIGPQNDEQKKG